MSNHSTTPGILHHEIFDKVQEGFDDAVIETARTRAQPGGVVPIAQSKRPSRRKAKTTVETVVAEPEYDYADPAQMADLAARYQSLNAGLQKQASEKVRIAIALEEANTALQEKDEQIAMLQKQVIDLTTQLNHEKDKIELLTRSPLFATKDWFGKVALAGGVTFVTFASFAIVFL